MKLVVFADTAALEKYSKELITRIPSLSIKMIVPRTIESWPRVAVEGKFFHKNEDSVQAVVELQFIEVANVLDAAKQLNITKDWTLYWRGGRREVIQGDSIDDAFRKAGYGGGAQAALDFYSGGDNHDYEYNSTTRDWDKK